MVLVKIRKNYGKILSGDPKVTMTYGTNHCGKQFFDEKAAFQYFYYYQKHYEN